jgi:hypothetical protein
VSLPAGPYEYGTIVHVTFPEYTGCPTGYTLSGYSFEVTNGTFTPANPVDRAATAIDITLPATDATVKVSYYAQCGDLRSSKSNVVDIPVTAPAP